MGRAAGLLFPLEEQLSIGSCDVVVFADVQAASDRIDPFRQAFDFAEVSDWSFVDHHVTLAIAPFRSEFLIAKAAGKPDGLQHFGHSFAIVHPGLYLPA